MATGKKDVEVIDESYLLASIMEQAQPTGSDKPRQATTNVEPVVEKSKDPAKGKGHPNMDYSRLFLQKNVFKTRQCVYISQPIHSTISEIVRVIAEKDITVGGYIDSILSEHLETHKKAINELYKNELYKKDRKGLIE